LENEDESDEESDIGPDCPFENMEPVPDREKEMVRNYCNYGRKS